MNTERDELLDLHGPLLTDIREQDDYAADDVHSISAYSEGAEHALDTVWAKGYRKPRAITSVEDLDVLGRGTAVLDAHQHVWMNDGDSLDQWGCVHHDEYPTSLVWRGSADVTLPATVLFSPKEASP